jgi:tetratricopeptide (TPR) repeat protein
MVLGDRLSDLHHYEEAGDAYRKATQLNPESDDLRNLVASFRQIRLLDDAIIIAEWVSIEKPDDVYNLVELGELRRQRGHVLKQTVEAYKKAEELEKDKPPDQRDRILHRWKAMALMQGRLSGEEVDDKQIIAECDAEIARQEAVAKARGKNVGEESAGGRSDKAKCLWVLGRLDESEKILREISSQSTSALFYLGWRCLQTQREAEGRKLLNGLVEKVPAGARELPDWELRPRALALLGQRDQAMEELTAIEQAEPGLKLTIAIEAHGLN